MEVLRSAEERHKQALHRATQRKGVCGMEKDVDEFWQELAFSLFEKDVLDKSGIEGEARRAYRCRGAQLK